MLLNIKSVENNFLLRIQYKAHSSGYRNIRKDKFNCYLNPNITVIDDKKYIFRFKCMFNKLFVSINFPTLFKPFQKHFIDYMINS